MYGKKFCKLKRTGNMFIILMESQLEPNLGFSPARECSMNWYVREQLPAKLRKLFPKGDIIAVTLGLDDILKMQNQVGVGGWEEDKEE